MNKSQANNAAQSNCFPPSVYDRFLNEQVEANEEARIIAHISQCKSCQSSLEKLAGQQEVWQEIKNHLTEGDETQHSDSAMDNTQRDRKRDLQLVKKLLGPTENPEMLGRLGSYEVIGIVGRGSAGIVVKALDTRLNRFVAIKLLVPAYSNNGCSRRRFEREGRAIASVKDPHVVPIHSVDEYQGTPFIVMPYLPNGSLDQRIQKHGPLDTSEVVCVGMQIAKGLAAAHKRGIVHRDVKPANVLLENGVEGAMVTDFGLARVVDEATMTRSGSISGTPQYMSPEQAKGESVDPRSDLFSLGSVMYAACTGHPPFKSKTVFGIIKKVCDDQPRPIREYSPGISQWLVDFIERLHEKRPQDRFESADQVAELLSHELAHLESPTMVAKPEREWWTKKTFAPRKPKYESGSKPKWIPLGIIGAIAAVALLAAGFWSSFGNGNGFPGTKLASGIFGSSAMGFLTGVIEQDEHFVNVTKKVIDVEPGGLLFLRTNLGTVNVSTHDKSTVEMKMTQTVAAEDQATADLLFAANDIAYSVNAGNKQSADELPELRNDRDATIMVSFPTKNITLAQIEDEDDVEKLKQQLLVQASADNFREVVFELLVPEAFNLDVDTGAGAIHVENLDGSVKLATLGGHIGVGKITGEADLKTLGGHIDIENIGLNGTLKTSGGHLEIGNVDGTLDASTHGGQIEVGYLHGASTLKTSGGEIRVWKTSAPVVAETLAGSVSVNFVKQPDGDSRLKTKAGSIKIGYVEGLAFDVSAKCKLGSVSGPFVNGKTNSLNHVLNDGTCKLDVDAMTGSVKFFVVDKADLAEYGATKKRGGREAFDIAYDLHMAGKIDEAIEAHKAAAKFSDFAGIATYNLGCAWSLKGEKDRAFDALNKSIDLGFDDRDQFEGDGDLDPLRDDARFEKLMSRLEDGSDDAGDDEDEVYGRGNEDEDDPDDKDPEDVDEINFGLKSTHRLAATSLELSVEKSKAGEKKIDKRFLLLIKNKEASCDQCGGVESTCDQDCECGNTECELCRNEAKDD